MQQEIAGHTNGTDNVDVVPPAVTFDYSLDFGDGDNSMYVALI